MSWFFWNWFPGPWSWFHDPAWLVYLNLVTWPAVIAKAWLDDKIAMRRRVRKKLAEDRRLEQLRASVGVRVTS